MAKLFVCDRCKKTFESWKMAIIDGKLDIDISFNGCTHYLKADSGSTIGEVCKKCLANELITQLGSSL